MNEDESKKDPFEWPGGHTTIRIVARKATEYMDADGNKTVWVKLKPNGESEKGQSLSGKEIDKNHPV